MARTPRGLATASGYSWPAIASGSPASDRQPSDQQPIGGPIDLGRRYDYDYTIDEYRKAVHFIVMHNINKSYIYLYNTLSFCRLVSLSFFLIYLFWFDISNFFYISLKNILMQKKSSHKKEKVMDIISSGISSSSRASFSEAS